MKSQILSLASLTAVASVSLLSASLPANAAALTGSFSINPAPAAGEGPGGVRLEGTGIPLPGVIDGVPGAVFVTNLDFGPPLGAGAQVGPGTGIGDGAIFEVNGTGDFVPFISYFGRILDLAVPNALCGGSCIYNGGVNAADLTSPVPDWIVVNRLSVDGAPVAGFKARLDQFLPTVLSSSGGGTTATIPTRITIVPIDAAGVVTGPASVGIGTLSADFVGLTPAQFLAAINNPGEISTNNGTWSAQFEVAAAVPEPSSMLGLMMLGLGGVAAKALKSKKES